MAIECLSSQNVLKGSPNTIVEQKDVAPFGIYTGIVESRAADVPNHFDRLPESRTLAIMAVRGPS